MSKEKSSEPKFIGDMPYFPMNFDDRDNIVGRLMEVLEAVMPEGQQLEATKNIVKYNLSQYWIATMDAQLKIIKNSDELVSYPKDFGKAVKALYKEFYPKTS